MLSDDELDRIDAYCAAATKGPWGGGKDYLHVGDALVRAEWGDISQENGNFIAKSRTDLPAVVAAYRELKRDHALCGTWKESAISRQGDIERTEKALNAAGIVTADRHGLLISNFEGVDALAAERDRLRREHEQLTRELADLRAGIANGGV